MASNDSLRGSDDCPRLEDLTAFFVGLLPGAERIVLEHHLISCGLCQTALAALRPDSGQHDRSTVTESPSPRGHRKTFEHRDTPAAATFTAEPQDAPISVRTAFPSCPRSLPYLRGQYQLLEKLGQGGMGTVYKAQHTRLKRLAVKTLRADRLANPQLLARFQHATAPRDLQKDYRPGQARAVSALGGALPDGLRRVTGLGLRDRGETRWVVTSRLHALLPCAAMGTPVVFVEPNHSERRIAGYGHLAWRIADAPWSDPRPKRAVEIIREMARPLRECIQKFIGS
jgi:hypothetical protein